MDVRPFFVHLNILKDIYSQNTPSTVIGKTRQILDCTKNNIYYKSTLIKWRGSSVG